jgi:hypothetical protein
MPIDVIRHPERLGTSGVDLSAFGGENHLLEITGYFQEKQKMKKRLSNLLFPMLLTSIFCVHRQIMVAVPNGDPLRVYEAFTTLFLHEKQR